VQRVAEAAVSGVKVAAGFEEASEKLAVLMDRKDRTLATLFTLTVARLICFAGNLFQGQFARISYPGLATLAITFAAVATANFGKKYFPDQYACCAVCAPSTSGLLLTLFFGAIGASARFTEVFKAGPAFVSFASVALLVHMVVITMGSRLVNAVAQRFGRRGERAANEGDRDADDGLITFDDVLVASNANIGGPSTAGSFASMVNRPALVFPAAVWGTVGYAIASTIGIKLWQVLSKV
jgi:hypothetical protein